MKRAPKAPAKGTAPGDSQEEARKAQQASGPGQAQEAPAGEATAESGSQAARANRTKGKGKAGTAGAKKAGEVRPEAPLGAALEATPEAAPESSGPMEAAPAALEDDPANLSARTQPRVKGFTVVGIGASAGGLKALEGFFRNQPENLNAAYVVIQHLDPSRASIMSDILGRFSSLQAITAYDGMTLQPGNIYVRPSEHDMVLDGARVVLQPLGERRHPLSIDRFLRSLAKEMGPRAVAVILSGAGSDGALGIRDINAAGGMIMVQDESQADYPSMPASAISTGLADAVLPVEKMGEELQRYMEHPYIQVQEMVESSKMMDESALNFLLQRVRLLKRHDFSGYKRNTLNRRIARRMAMHQIPTLQEYIGFVSGHVEEVEALFRDLLINVTSFYRDPQAWEKLKSKVLIPLVNSKSDEEDIRVWSAGCATGEEAYTLGMLLTEAMDVCGRKLKVKIFATDINDMAIKQAREGVYQTNIEADVSRERLARFFTRLESSYVVKPFLREMMIFAVHDLVRDPPFSRLDLISCRNLLIYMESGLQRRLIPVMHYALRPGGHLMLGTSEGVSEFADLFRLEDKKWKVFQARKAPGSVERYTKEAPLSLPHDMLAQGVNQPSPGEAIQTQDDTALSAALDANGNRASDFQRITEQALLEHSSSGVLLDWRDQVTYFHGDTELFLAPPIGNATFDILSMAKTPIHEALENGIREVRRTGRPWRQDGLPVRSGGSAKSVDMEVLPAGKSPQGPDYLLVIFHDRGPNLETGDGSEEANARVAALKRQLQSVRQDLQATIEELETSNEELKSSNEEQQANNEELQSINEELETSREELQSTNEELEQVNMQLQKKNEELTKVNNDIRNLFAATDVGILFLDENLHIKRFTPAIQQIFNLIEERDLGRPVTDISHRLTYSDLDADARAVLDTLNEKLQEVGTADDNWFRMRIRPYRTAENVIDGLVISFTDITEIRRAAMAETEARIYAESVFESINTPLLVVDTDLRVHAANAAFLNAFKAAPDKIVGARLLNLNGGVLDLPDLRTRLEGLVSNQARLEDYRVEADFPRLGHKAFMLSASQIDFKAERPPLILISFRNVTGQQ